MNKKETILQEQEAPVKNTDDAFVQVGANGQPQVPGEEKERGHEDEPVPQQEPLK